MSPKKCMFPLGSMLFSALSLFSNTLFGFALELPWYWTAYMDGPMENRQAIKILRILERTV